MLQTYGELQLREISPKFHKICCDHSFYANMLDPSRKYLRVGTHSLFVLRSLFLKPLQSKKQITISKTFDVHVLNSHPQVINLDSLLQAVLGSYRFDVILCKALKQPPFLAAQCFNHHRLSLPRNRSLSENNRPRCSHVQEYS